MSAASNPGVDDDSSILPRPHGGNEDNWLAALAAVHRDADVRVAAAHREADARVEAAVRAAVAAARLVAPAVDPLRILVEADIPGDIASDLLTLVRPRLELHLDALKLRYAMRVHGPSGRVWASRMCGKDRVLTVIRVGECWFGGFTWDAFDREARRPFYDDLGFLFTLRNPRGSSPALFDANVNGNEHDGIVSCDADGTFWFGVDLAVTPPYDAPRSHCRTLKRHGDATVATLHSDVFHKAGTTRVYTDPFPGKRAETREGWAVDGLYVLTC